MAQKEIKLPRLPHGQGSFSWRDSTHTKIKFQRNYKSKTDGKTYRLQATAATVKECYELMEHKEQEKEAEIKRTYRHSLDNRTVILSDAIREWLVKTKMDRNKANSFDRDECTLDNQIEKYDIGRLQAIEVTADDISKHLDFLLYSADNGVKRGYSYSVVRKTYELLNQFFAYFYAKDVNSNPMHLVKRPERKKNVAEITLDDNDSPNVIADLILSDYEIKIFKDACMREPKNGVTGGTKYGLHLYFILLTFLRVGEAITLVWSDVDWGRRLLRVNKAVSRVKNRDSSGAKTKVILTTPKTQHGIRDVGLTDEAIRVLQMIKARSNFTAPNDYIFATNKGTIVPYTHLYKVLKGVLKSSGLNQNGERDGFTLHYLRHSGISFYIRKGVPLDVISEMAGHADTYITRNTYYHIINEQKRDAISMMNDIKI